MRLVWAEAKVADSDSVLGPMVHAVSVAMRCADSTVVDWQIDAGVDSDLGIDC